MNKNYLWAAMLIAITSVGLNWRDSTAAAPDSQPKTAKSELYFEGPWVTTKTKQLNGTITCRVEPLSPGRWRGRFWGTWQQVPLDYTVEFAVDSEIAHTRTVAVENGVVAGGVPVAGKAMIDGASYDWKGLLSPDQFTIQFTGSRYEGHLELKRIAEKTPPKQSEAADANARTSVPSAPKEN
jgi:hypothetical protein